jgi:ATP-dependent DNA ligase
VICFRPRNRPSPIYKGFSAERFQASPWIGTAEESEGFYCQRQIPVRKHPRIPEKIQWVKPLLVCEVAFAEWTEDEQLRQTTFLGWREDKSPEEVVINRQF